jgi:hypothetical protein
VSPAPATPGQPNGITEYLQIVRDLIRREFGVKLSEVQVGRILRDMGLSPQRPLYRACQKNPGQVDEWKKVIYPEIRERARREGAEIFFADEAQGS